MTNLVQSLLVPIVTIIGVIVLIALKDISGATGLPIVVAIAGVHLGANLSGPSVPTTAIPVVTSAKPVAVPTPPTAV